MYQTKYIGILAALVFLFFTPVYASNSCALVYSHQGQTLNAADKTSPPSAKPSTYQQKQGVERNPDFVKELIHNRHHSILSYKDLRNQQVVQWFLSLSNNGRLWRVMIHQGFNKETLDFYADRPTPEVEKAYYRKIADMRNMTDLVFEVKLPRKGRRDMIVPPNILAKLEIKHEITPEELIKVARSVNPNVRYRPNNDPHFQGRDSFIMFVGVEGSKNPMELVILQENNTYILLTAFINKSFRE